MERFSDDSHDPQRQRQTSLSTDAEDRSSLDKCYEDVLTHEEKDAKLLETPIVYTTKLDDMDILNQISGDLDINLNDITNRILRESKPSIKNPPLHYSRTDQASYDRVVKKVKELNDTGCRNDNCNDRYFQIAQENQIENETTFFLEQLNKSNNNDNKQIVINESESMNSNITITDIDKLVEDVPVIDHKINSETKNDTPTSFIEIKSDEEDDIQLIENDTLQRKTSTIDIENKCKSNKIIKRRKRKKLLSSFCKSRKYENLECDNTIIIDTDTDSEEDVPLSIIKHKKLKLNNLKQCKELRIVLQDIGIRRKKLREKPFNGPGFLYCGNWYPINEILFLKRKIRNVYLFFHDKCTQIVDIYIIENGCMKEHIKLNFSQSSVVLKNNFNLKETIEIECYCWYERVQASLKALESGILSTYDVTFMRQRHNCEQSTCVCCCSMQNNKEKESMTVGDYKMSEEDLELKHMEEEISQKISTIQTKDIHYSVLNHNDWNCRLKIENNTPTLINECLRHNRDNTKYSNRKSDELKLPTNGRYINLNLSPYIYNKSLKNMLQPKSHFEANSQEQNTNIKPKSLFTPDRVKRLSEFPIERSNHARVPEMKMSTKSTTKNYSGNIIERPTQNKADTLDDYHTSAKCAQTPNNKKEAVVCRSQFSDEKHEKSSNNILNAEYTETKKVKSVAELIDSVITQHLGGAFSAEKATQEPRARNLTGGQQTEKSVSSDNVNDNDNVISTLTDSPETDDSGVNSLITTILKRFEGIHLTINEDRKVAASLNMPINTLSLSELKVLASIISEAQQQVDALALLPGPYLAKLKLKQNKDNNVSGEINKHQQSSSHPNTNKKVSQAQQNINEVVPLPETNFPNIRSLGQITDHHHSNKNSPVTMNKEISSRHKKNNMVNTDAICTGGINYVNADSHVYKMFSKIVKKKNDCYKKSFMAVKPYPVLVKPPYKESSIAVNSNPVPVNPPLKESSVAVNSYPIAVNPPPDIKICNVYSLAADSATKSLPNKTKSHKCIKKRNMKMYKFPSKEIKQSSDFCIKRRRGRGTMKVSDLISAQRDTELKKSKIRDQSGTLNPRAQTSKTLVELPKRVANYQIILNDSANPQKDYALDSLKFNTITEEAKACNSHLLTATNKNFRLGLPSPMFSGDIPEKLCHNDTNPQLMIQLNAELSSLCGELQSLTATKHGEETDLIAETAQPEDFALDALDSSSNIDVGLALNEEVHIKEETEFQSYENE